MVSSDKKVEHNKLQVLALAPRFSEKTLEKLRKMRREQRLKWHKRRIQREIKVFEVVDSLRRSYVLNDDDIAKQLLSVKNSIQVTEAYIQIRQLPEFLKLRQKQLYFRKVVVDSAVKRYPYMEDIEKYKSIILKYLYTEALYLDLMSDLEQQIESICKKYGVSGYPFFEAGRLLGNIWSIAARQLLSEVGKI